MSKPICEICEEEVEQGDISNGVCSSCCEKAYDRWQESLMENGPGPTLLEQQQEADKIRKGRR